MINKYVSVIYAGAKDGRLAVAIPDTMTQIKTFYRSMGYKTYEIKDWLGTPRLTFSDIKLPLNPNDSYSNYTYKLDYLSATTTYPFGARIDSLSFESPSYRFGFTGHLKDNNIRPEKGDGANYSTLFRENDPIIGRWWSIDPLRTKYAGMSPYNYSGDNPINAIDNEGSWFWVVNGNVPRSFPTTDKEHFTSLASDRSFIPNDLQGQINSFIPEFIEKAPAVGNFLKNNEIRTALAKDMAGASGVTISRHDSKGKRLQGNIIISKDSYSGTFNNPLYDLKLVVFHEGTHSMGYGEFFAWSATAAAGFISKKDFFNAQFEVYYLIDGCAKKDQDYIRSTFYKWDDKQGRSVVPEELQDRMWNLMLNIGKKVNNNEESQIDRENKANGKK